MKRKAVIAAAVILLTAAVLYIFFALTAHDGGDTAVITLDGEVIRRIELSSAKDGSFTVESENGYNVITVKNKEIYVSDADCPDKVCVNHGALKTAMLPIVCLPHKLIITLE